MRFKLSFNLENNRFPILFQKSILSFIKYSLSEYNEEYYKKLYDKKDNAIKPYTFSIYFHKPKFEGDEIILEKNEIDLNMSVSDYELAIVLYNSFNNQRNKKFSLNRNSMLLRNISLVHEKEILEESITIKFMSPLCVRERNQETRKDMYYSFEHEKFIDILKVNIKEQLKISKISPDVVDTFNIEPVNAKKAVIKFYEKKIECSVGAFKIFGNKELLNYLYKSGMGSKHSSGFGMFNVI
jgi:CRISPR-associated endoribonuclease Cas6